jgi:hypothetical protein
MGDELIKSSNNQQALTSRRNTFTLLALIADKRDKAAERSSPSSPSRNETCAASSRP